MLVCVAIMATAMPARSAPATSDPDQVITVRVTSSSATTGVLEAWERRGEDFARVHGPIPVFVGEDGVGSASERRSRTPRGVFTLTEAFGLASNPGTSLPYVRVGAAHWWVSDVKSRYYNQMRRCIPGARCGFRQSRSEQLGRIGAYEYAIVMDYNRDPVVPGRGSAFFLHVSEGRPTQGCISMAESDLTRLLRWLRPAEHPVVAVDIGRAAYVVLG